MIVVGLGADVKLFLPGPPSVSDRFVVYSSGLQVHGPQVRRDLPHGCGGEDLLDVQVVVGVQVPEDVLSWLEEKRGTRWSAFAR